MSRRVLLVALVALAAGLVGGGSATAAMPRSVIDATSAPDGVSWARPVAGRVTRGFDLHGSPFTAGQHRGVDLSAPPGAPVRAPCGGRVVVAGHVGAAGRVVTVACGPWHASVLPLARVDVRRGARVEAGDRVGAAGALSLHLGVHLGVRRTAQRFGYVDPLRFLPRGRPWPSVGPPPTGDGDRRGAPPPEPARPTLAPGPAPRDPAPRGIPEPPAERSPVVAPWPVWLGASLLLAGGSGGLVRARRRPRGRGTAAARPALTEEIR